jgi:single-stranded-DNA-specific exonuclease
MLNYQNIESVTDSNHVRNLADSLKVPVLISKLLVARGICDFDAAKTFFRPNLNELHDPFLMKNMTEAVDRMSLAFTNKERILIFGDYDVDGTSAVAQMVLALSKWGFDVHFYIPDRYTEGYGVSLQGIDYAIIHKCKLFIALDCGTKAVDKIAYARSKGLDVIVCDHHKPGEDLPDSILLNHKQDDCAYPFKELTGCGIGFKLLQGMSQRLNLDEEVYWDLLDLNALSIGADIVPVNGENRILAYYGLKQINEKPLRIGLRALLEQANKTRPLTLSNVVFVIAPRINAAGRMESGKTAVNLLISSNLDEARLVAKRIEEFNTQRRQLDTDITEEILNALDLDDDFESLYSTVVYGEIWKKGVIGIVASRLIERYYRPTVVLTKSDDEHAVGSVRSVHGFDVHEALMACSAFLVQFGGHMYAAGLTVRIDQIENFKLAFEQYVSQYITENQRIEPLDIDLEIDLNELFEAEESVSPLPKVLRLLKQFEPHGPENMRPVFLAKGCFLNPERTRIVGEKHLKTELYVPGKTFGISAIGFNMADQLELAMSGVALDIVFVLEENVFQDRSSMQAQIRALSES